MKELHYKNLKNIIKKLIYKNVKLLWINTVFKYYEYKTKRLEWQHALRITRDLFLYCLWPAYLVMLQIFFYWETGCNRFYQYYQIYETLLYWFVTGPRILCGWLFLKLLRWTNTTVEWIDFLIPLFVWIIIFGFIIYQLTFY